MRGEYKIKTKMLRKMVTALVLVLIIGVVGVAVVLATTEDEREFSTIEDEESILMAEEGQEQVREVRFKELKEERILAEKKAEEERKRQEAIAEKKRIAEAKKKAEEEKPVKSATSSRGAAPKQSGNNLGTFEATAYGPDCVGCSGVTANGTDIRNGNIYSNGYRVIAADPRVIPMNSIVKITYSSGQTEMAKVCDTGGAIKGRIIDIAHVSQAEAKPFGRQQVQIELIK